MPDMPQPTCRSTSHDLNRRQFTTRIGGLAAGLMLPAGTASSTLKAADDSGESEEKLFRISLAQWSLRNHFRGERVPQLDNLQFPAVARSLGFDAVEYLNQFCMDKSGDDAYFQTLAKRAADEGVTSVLMMCDRTGSLGDPDKERRHQAVQDHVPWLNAAAQLGCHAIRVNARSRGSYVEQQKLAADGLHQLCEHADPLGLSVLVENHGGWSSHGRWLVDVMKMVDHPRVGTLPDFGNFRIHKASAQSPELRYDPYLLLHELMPFARGVSAKSKDFDALGNETTVDYRRLIDIVLRHDYHGHIGVEFGGGNTDRSQFEGAILTRRLLERIRDKKTA